MSDHNVKLAGHFQNLVGQCPMTDCYFQHCCHWCTRDVQQKFENIVEENWTRLHGITTKSLLVGNGKNIEKNTRHLRP